MNKTIIGLIVALSLIGISVFIIGMTDRGSTDANNIITRIGPQRPEDAAYVIGGQPVVLKDGLSEVNAAPGSASKITTRYFGNAVKLDLNGDGKEDAVFLLTQNAGGSGTFYYLVAALNTSKGYVGGQGYLLGDRIAPQTTELGKGGNIIIVNYADRAQGQSFAVPPSIGKSIWLQFDANTMEFSRVIVPGETSDGIIKVSLGSKTWNWVSTKYNDGTEKSPRDTRQFSLILKDKGVFSATTDCNGIGGNYVMNGNKITFSRMISTMMFCEGSQEDDYRKMLESVGNYSFTDNGELLLGLKFDSGSMIYK